VCCAGQLDRFLGEKATWTTVLSGLGTTQFSLLCSCNYRPFELKPKWRAFSLKKKLDHVKNPFSQCMHPVPTATNVRTSCAHDCVQQRKTNHVQEDVHTAQSRACSSVPARTVNAVSSDLLSCAALPAGCHTEAGLAWPLHPVPNRRAGTRPPSLSSLPAVSCHHVRTTPPHWLTVTGASAAGAPRTRRTRAQKQCRHTDESALHLFAHYRYTRCL
jgi:hypothetical protein